jgi:prophage regulatory protein
MNPKTAPTLDKLLSLKEVADLLGLSVRAVYRLIDAGELPQPLKVGRSSRIRASDYQAYVNRLIGQQGVA